MTNQEIIRLNELYELKKDKNLLLQRELRLFAENTMISVFDHLIDFSFLSPVPVVNIYNKSILEEITLSSNLFSSFQEYLLCNAMRIRMKITENLSNIKELIETKKLPIRLKGDKTSILFSSWFSLSFSVTANGKITRVSHIRYYCPRRKFSFLFPLDVLSIQVSPSFMKTFCKYIRNSGNQKQVRKWKR